jgi:hypothetical protein
MGTPERRAMGAWCARCCLLILGLLLVAPAPVKAEESRLSRPEARDLATAFLRQDRPMAAHALALGLLEADARDYSALMILSRAEAKLGRPEKSEIAARRAWRVADSPDEKFAAAYTLSQALSGQDRYGAAQWWLRRARQASDRPVLDRAAKAQFARVRSANPMTTRLSFSVKPSSNINGGPTSNTFTIGGITFVNPAAVPLSGVEYSSSLTLRRDITPNAAKGAPKLHIGVAVDDRRYSLSSEAKRAVPTAKASDYAFTELEVFGGAVLPDASGRAQSTIDLTLGHNWYGHDPLAEYARLDLGRDWALNGGRLVGLGLSYEDQKRHDIRARSSETLRFSGYWRTPVADKGKLTLGLSVAETTSESSAIAHDALVASVNYAPEAEVLGTQSRFSLAVVGREYDRARYGPTPRSDRKLVAGAEFTFSKLEYMSFAPTLGVNYARNRSNVSLFDSREFGLSLGFRSTF